MCPADTTCQDGLCSFSKDATPPATIPSSPAYVPSSPATIPSSTPVTLPSPAVESTTTFLPFPFQGTTTTQRTTTVSAPAGSCDIGAVIKYLQTCAIN